ncbi:hypothetical protein TH5N_05150 [Tetragenococcus halophilus]|nr:hypothetical protein TH3N_05150 [Tetragenococcus halophilus]GEQ39637.1 hypothetical protein TH5N_05150 [Tetragenococcus halophilus]GEQ42294.1 hypothetical protein TH6N_09200 [Tetragenococcus halophilus]GEQ44024.1 hypothetical protein TH8N_03940 [Tetragenococcus halophilus]GEQ46499.1 hypothetical protein TH9N_06120 [Tetragenococcus halophilus]
MEQTVNVLNKYSLRFKSISNSFIGVYDKVADKIKATIVKNILFASV